MSASTRISCPECGWTSKPGQSEAMAAYALRRHRCERQRMLTERAARVAARVAVDGPKRDCQCKRTHHEHGDRTAYVVDRCRCRPCRLAANAYEQRRTRNRAYGRITLVPAEPVRAHVRSLGAQGMGWKRVALAAGVQRSTVWKLLYGDPTRGLTPSKRVRPATAAKILAVTLDVAPGARIDGAGTRRRLQALVTLGWSISELGRRIGITHTSNINLIIHGKNGRGVEGATAAKVRALYDELWDTPFRPTTRWEATARGHALRTAHRWGWVGPLAWDDDTIDDPDATPRVTAEVDVVLDEVAIARVMAGGHARLTEDERIEVVRRLAAAGLSDNAVAQRLGVHERTVCRIRAARHIASTWAA